MNEYVKTKTLHKTVGRTDLIRQWKWQSYDLCAAGINSLTCKSMLPIGVLRLDALNWEAI